MKRFMMVAGWVDYNPRFTFYKVGGVIDGRIRQDGYVYVINPDGSIYDAKIGDAHYEDIFNGIVEDCFASVNLYLAPEQQVLKGAVITNILPYEINDHTTYNNVRVKALLNEVCRNTFEKYDLKYKRIGFFPFKTKHIPENDMYENRSLLLDELKRAIVSTGSLVFLDASSHVEEQPSSTVISYSRLKLAEMDGKVFVPVFTDMDAVKEADKQGFSVLGESRGFVLNYKGILSLASEYDGFVINPFCENNIAFSKNDAVEMGNIEPMKIVYYGEKAAVEDDNDTYNKILYRKPQSDKEPILYNLILDDKVTEHLYVKILECITELRPLKDEKVRIVFDYLHPGKVYFLDIYLKDDGYLVDVGRFKKGGNEYSVLRSNHGEKYRIYRLPEMLPDMKSLSAILKTILLNGKFPAKIDWKEVTIYRKYEDYLNKLVKVIYDMGYLDQQYLLDNYPNADTSLDLLVEDGVLDHYSLDDYEDEYKLVVPIGELPDRYPRAFKPITVGMELCIIKWDHKLQGRLCTVKDIFTNDGCRKYLVYVPTLDLEVVLSEDEVMIATSL